MNIQPAQHPEKPMPLGPELRFVDRTKVIFEEKTYVFFGGTDYHRMASHPEVLRAVREATESDCLNMSGSRISTGNHRLYMQLEAKAATFLGADESAICSEGYLSNAVALEAVSRDFQRFFIDGSAHASLMIAADCLPRDRVHIFLHSDPESLRKSLETHLRPSERLLVLTNGVEPADGELSPLAGYWEAVRNEGGMLIVDDAHGMGTTGLTGKGSPEEAHLPVDSFIQTGTFSKAFGVFGGVVAGRAGLFSKVVEHSRTFTGSTPLLLPLAAAALRSIEILQEHPEMITSLRARTLHFRKRVRAMGLPSCNSPAPVLSVTHRNEAKNQRLRSLLLQNGIYPPFSYYPGCPPGGHFRFALSSVHTDEEVDRLLDSISLSCD